MEEIGAGGEGRGRGGEGKRGERLDNKVGINNNQADEYTYGKKWKLPHTHTVNPPDMAKHSQLVRYIAQNKYGEKYVWTGCQLCTHLQIVRVE